jgi:hypothetical protein
MGWSARVDDMRGFLRRSLYWVSGVLVFYALCLGAWVCQVRHSDFIERALAASEAYPCVGDIYDRMHPNWNSSYGLARHYEHSKGKAGNNISHQIKEMAVGLALDIRFSKSRINQMIATLPISGFENSDDMSRFFFERNYCDLNQGEQDIITAYRWRLDIRRLEPRIRLLNNPHALEALAELTHKTRNEQQSAPPLH